MRLNKALIYQIEFDDRALKELRKLSSAAQKQILDYLRARIGTNLDPRRFGKPLVGSATGLWRYRVQDYRIVCEINDQTVTVLVVRVGHRRKIYRN